MQDELSKAILELQKDRFFEALQAKYWNSSAKSAECPNSDESEGITLESLGGVFIATLFGLALAMITLVVEVIYYRRRDSIENAVIHVQPASEQKTPPPSYDADQIGKAKKFKNTDEDNLITLGADKFIPASLSQRVPYMPVYQRRPIHSAQSNEYIA